MDVFKQNRYLMIVIVLLVILNVGTLLMLWIGKPQKPVLPAGERIPDQLPRLLKNEFGFNDNQIEKFMKSRDKHRRQMMQLNNEIRSIKKQMFDEVFTEDPQPVLSDSLLKLSQEKQAQIEQLTYQHFFELRKMCNPEQQKKLQKMIHEIFHQQLGGMRDGPPPPRRNGNLPAPPPPADH